ncbi:MAG: hypothetical protein NTW05_05665 [Pseudonocardiales bacterium]|nr:hypothetical protein [Pseudonocardiales bacterium]
MSSETDHPRQRTVAELLAAHGGEAAASGRRRRRREADESDGAPAAGPRVDDTAAAPAVDRSVLREPAQREPAQRDPAQLDRAEHDAGRYEPAPYEPAPYEPAAYDRAPREPVRRAAPVVPPQPGPQQPALQQPAPPQAAPQQVAPQQAVSPAPAAPPRWSPEPARSQPEAPTNGQSNGHTNGHGGLAGAAFPTRAPAQGRERPTDVIPRIREPEPLESYTRPAQDDHDDDGGPSTMVGQAPVGAEEWHRARTGSRGGTAIDGGPPLPPGPVDEDDGPAGLGPSRRGPSVDLRKHDDDYGDDYDDYDPDVAAEFEAPPPRQRRLGRAAAAARDAAAPAWSAVIVQWVAGALGGAVLWVLFRFLWRNLPVVALAASAIVTIGLVLVVRALLHNNDRRTTVFAVLVGLLLTVSPAILVLMGR